MAKLTLFDSSERLLADDDRGRITYTPGFVDAGTNVAIFLTSEAKGGSTRLLLPNALVLAIGNKTSTPQDSTTTGTEAASVPTTILTIAGDQGDFQRVLYGSTHGRLNLGLLGKDFTPSASILPTTENNLFPK